MLWRTVEVITRWLSKLDLWPRDLKLMALSRVSASIPMTYTVYYQCISPASVLFCMFNPFMRHSTRLHETGMMAKRFALIDVTIKPSKPNWLLVSLKLNKFGGASTAHALHSLDTNVNVCNITTLSHQLHCFVGYSADCRGEDWWKKTPLVNSFKARHTLPVFVNHGHGPWTREVCIELKMGFYGHCSRETNFFKVLIESTKL